MHAQHHASPPDIQFSPSDSISCPFHQAFRSNHPDEQWWTGKRAADVTRGAARRRRLALNVKVKLRIADLVGVGRN